MSQIIVLPQIQRLSNKTTMMMVVKMTKMKKTKHKLRKDPLTHPKTRAKVKITMTQQLVHRPMMVVVKLVYTLFGNNYVIKVVHLNL